MLLWRVQNPRQSTETWLSNHDWVRNTPIGLESDVPAWKDLEVLWSSCFSLIEAAKENFETRGLARHQEGLGTHSSAR